MIKIENLHKTFNPGSINEVYALKNIDLHINDGDFITIIGTNGSGKSTLLNAIAGAFLPDRGTILIDGKDMTHKKDYQRAKLISRVFQNPFQGTAPNMTIAENLHIASLRGRKECLSAALASPVWENCPKMYRHWKCSLKAGCPTR